MIDHELEYRFKALMEVALEADEALDELFEEVLEESGAGASPLGGRKNVRGTPRDCH